MPELTVTIILLVVLILFFARWEIKQEKRFTGNQLNLLIGQRKFLETDIFIAHWNKRILHNIVTDEIIKL
jgi:glycopeptide antibiotics resistance protein